MSAFRTEQRRSNVRANIFLVECVIVLFAYVSQLHHRLGPIARQRSVVLTAFGVVYFVRLNFMSRYLLQRELSIEELTVVTLLWLPSILASFAFLSNGDVDLPANRCAALNAIYCLGSALNTYSEYQRKMWKDHPVNKGRCYTGGLFAFSRNINYLGDVILFAAWAAATGGWINAWAPVTMAGSFWFHHIPDKEIYLSKRYGRDWDEYVSKTPYEFIPFLY